MGLSYNQENEWLVTVLLFSFSFYEIIAQDIYNYIIIKTNLHQILYSTTQIPIISNIRGASTPIIGEDCLYLIFEE